MHNKFTEIKESVQNGKPVYLAPNGYGSMAVLNLEQYSVLTDEIEIRLDESNKAVAEDSILYTDDEVLTE